MKADELTNHPLFKLCTLPEQLFLQKYLSSRDITTSAREAFPKLKPSTTIQRLQKNDTVAALLSIMAGASKPTKDDLARKIWQVINGAKRPHEVARLSEILSDLEGWGVKQSPSVDVSEVRRQLAKDLYK